MEETSGIATPSPVEAANSTASANPVSPESLTYQANPNPVEMYPANNPDHNMEGDVATGTGERMSRATLKAFLQRQLEYYFSRENLLTDEYLMSQMDSENFVLISTVAKFNQIRRLTDDHNLVVEVLRESAVVQVDDAGEKVRPNPRSNVLILREIPEDTPIQELEEIFGGENCPKFSKCEFAHNDSWYVLFDSDEDTQKAYQYLREEAKLFRGKPVMARIKAKAITSAPFTTSYKNGYTNTQETESYNGQNVNQQQQPTPIQYSYNVANENYNNQQVCPPFYPPTMLQAWAPTTPACVDLGTVLSVNGLTPQTAFRPLPGNNNRHNYTSTRERPVKAYTPQNYNFSRSEQTRYFNRGQSTSYLGRQQLHQPAAASFPNIVNASTFDYLPYAARSRNIHNFGVDMNFFTAPNLYYSKLPSMYPSHASQTRHNTVLMPRSQVGVGAINCQDQSYIAVGNSNAMPYSKDSGMNTASGSKQGADPQIKENWASNQRQQRGKRWWKENGTSSSRNYSDNSNNAYNKSLSENETKPESPKFDLETTSFPPLPGCLETDIIDVDVYESRLSDIVKGTVKPATRDTKTQTSESGLVCTTKDSSTITIEDAVIPTDGAFTPPDSPDVMAETGSTTEPINVENCREPSEWDDFAESSTDTLCSSSINPINIVPEAPTTFNGNSTQVFHPLSTNSLVNGSVVTTESSAPLTLPEAEPIANVPSEITNEKQTATVKLPKAKQLDSVPKNSRPQCDLPSPKNKTPDALVVKSKFDSFKDRAPVAPKHRTSFSNSSNNNNSSSSNNNKNCDSSSNNKIEKMNDCLQTVSKMAEHNVSKNNEVFNVKDKSVQGHGKGKVLDSNSNKVKAAEVDSTLPSVNGHVDSESSTVSSEDEKQASKTKPTYLEVAMRAKDRLEKKSQEIKDKERQEAMVRQRQHESVAQSRHASTRGPFKDFPKGRTVEARPGSKEWRERKKPQTRAICLPAAGQ